MLPLFEQVAEAHEGGLVAFAEGADHLRAAGRFLIPKTNPFSVEMLRVIGGVLTGADAEFTGVSTDSRSL
mgnify:CR=1 FL=1